MSQFDHSSGRMAAAVIRAMRHNTKYHLLRIQLILLPSHSRAETRGTRDALRSSEHESRVAQRGSREEIREGTGFLVADLLAHRSCGELIR